MENVRAEDEGTEEDPIYVAREDRLFGPVVGYRFQLHEAMQMLVELRYTQRESNWVHKFEQLFLSVSLLLER